jgi:hypothetical protein
MSEGVNVVVYFPPSKGQMKRGFHVRFGVPPKKGDLLRLNPDSVKPTGQRSARLRVVAAYHDINLAGPEGEDSTGTYCVEVEGADDEEGMSM